MSSVNKVWSAPNIYIANEYKTTEDCKMFITLAAVFDIIAVINWVPLIRANPYFYIKYIFPIPSLAWTSLAGL